MKTDNFAPPTAKPPDPDQAEQARPGFGVPSQDPRVGAQSPLSKEEAEREAKSALVGGGALAGAATGALIGVAVAGPMGVIVGGTAGAVAGVMGGAAAGVSIKPEVPVDTEATGDVPAAADHRRHPLD
ncbi:MAG: bacteriocin [Rubrivivax sp.]|nr:bacteriocin [Rubrivivax sp.]MDP3222541.1 bacteriocin [Rubrivivax sp.]